MMLTTHFSDTELGVYGCEQRLIDNATFLCNTILEPLRLYYMAPLLIHDGYRNPAHNASVGGKTKSYHLYENDKAAADIGVVGYSYGELFNYLRLVSGLPFDKVILEHDKNGVDRCVHVQINKDGNNRRQAFIGGTGDSHEYVQVECR